MKRKRKNNKNDIIIDLTSMLDVIFIVLLVVMVGQKVSAFKHEQENSDIAESYNDAVNSYNDAAELYNDMMSTAKYFKTASIIVPYDEEEVYKRTIKIQFWGNEETEEIKLTGNDTERAFNEFYDSLEKYILENSGNPVILSLNDDDGKILYRDEKVISGIIMELSEKYENVYIKGNLSEVE